MSNRKNRELLFFHGWSFIRSFVKCGNDEFSGYLIPHDQGQADLEWLFRFDSPQDQIAFVDGGKQLAAEFAVWVGKRLEEAEFNRAQQAEKARRAKLEEEQRAKQAQRELEAKRRSEHEEELRLRRIQEERAEQERRRIEAAAAEKRAEEEAAAAAKRAAEEAAEAAEESEKISSEPDEDSHEVRERAAVWDLVENGRQLQNTLKTRRSRRASHKSSRDSSQGDVPLAGPQVFTGDELVSAVLQAQGVLKPSSSTSSSPTNTSKVPSLTSRRPPVTPERLTPPQPRISPRNSPRARDPHLVIRPESPWNQSFDPPKIVLPKPVRLEFTAAVAANNDTLNGVEEDAEVGREGYAFL